MKIAILGTRGIPANYGGFETFAEQLSTRLVARRHEVTVYGRKHYSTSDARFHCGVELRMENGEFCCRSSRNEKERHNKRRESTSLLILGLKQMAIDMSISLSPSAG